MTEYVAANLTLAEVQSKLNSATGDGDGVRLPAGSVDWAGQATWTAPANAYLVGAGTTALGGGDATNITDNYASNNPILAITTNATGTFRLSGITFKGGTGSVKENGIVNFSGSCAQFRFDHCRIDKSVYSVQNTGKFMLVGGTIYGVIDHCIFDPGPKIGWIHIVNGYPVGHAAWAAATNFGGSNFLFIEDCQFNGVVDGVQYFGVLTDCHTGGRFVVRYCTIVAGGVGQTHPTGHSGDDRGCRAHEIYGNTVTTTHNPATEEPNFAFDYNNSGPALIWNNTFDQVYKNIIRLDVIRKDNGTYAQTATPDGWGYAGTTFNGTGSDWDENSVAATGYACLDQPGRGVGDLLTGTFPDMVNDRTDTIDWPEQALEPIYEWQNTGTIVSGWGGAYLANAGGTRIAANRDYYLYTASFDGTVGVGVGTLANRPATCTAGVAYWATDTNTLYKATATNTWSAYYTPYTYPHPLQGVSSAAGPIVPCGTVGPISSI